jgi:hypothetical protein
MQVKLNDFLTPGAFSIKNGTLQYSISQDSTTSPSNISNDACNINEYIANQDMTN